MKQQIQFLIHMVRAHPRYAAMAIALDTSIGIIAAALVYILLNSASISPSTQAVLIFSGLLAIAGIFGVGYTLLKDRLGTSYLSDEFDAEDDNDESMY